MKNRIVEIAVDDVVEKKQLRESPGDLRTLENSIKKLGLLFPIVVDRNNVLISGSRRLAACRNIGLKKVPALRMDVGCNTMTALAIRTDENLCRKPLSAEDFERHIQAKLRLSSPSRQERFFRGIRKRLSRG